MKQITFSDIIQNHEQEVRSTKILQEAKSIQENLKGKDDVQYLIVFNGNSYRVTSALNEALRSFEFFYAITQYSIHEIGIPSVREHHLMQDKINALLEQDRA